MISPRPQLHFIYLCDFPILNVMRKTSKTWTKRTENDFPMHIYICRSHVDLFLSFFVRFQIGIENQGELVSTSTYPRIRYVQINIIPLSCMMEGYVSVHAYA